MDSNHRDDLDNMLDQALRGYVVEPRPGLEARVLTRVQASRTRRSFRFLSFAIATPAVLLLAVLFIHQSQQPPSLPIVVNHPPVPVILPATLVPAVAPKRLPRRPREARDLPRQEVFPTPVPLTPEEQAILRLAENHPEQLQAINDAPLEIREIKIEPLPVGGTI